MFTAAALLYAQRASRQEKQQTARLRFQIDLCLPMAPVLSVE
jgi:hypothetical protein